MSETQKELVGPRGVRLVLDRKKVHENDPGADTPALVYYRGGCSTYWCATGEGEVLKDDCGTVKLPKDVMEWLDEQDSLLTEFLYGSRA